jgi:hypothetical protein
VNCISTRNLFSCVVSIITYGTFTLYFVCSAVLSIFCICLSFLLVNFLTLIVTTFNVFQPQSGKYNYIVLYEYLHKIDLSQKVQIYYWILIKSININILSDFLCFLIVRPKEIMTSIFICCSSTIFSNIKSYKKNIT